MDKEVERRASLARLLGQDEVEIRRASLARVLEQELVEVRRSSKPRILERSQSYSQAIDNSGRSSIEIPKLEQTEIYVNEEYKRRVSQNYVHGKEVILPQIDLNDHQYDTSSSSDDEQNPNGLRMRIDVETNHSKIFSQVSSPTNFSEASTRIMVSPSPDYESIEVEESVSPNSNFTSGYASPYTRRSTRKNKNKHRRQHGRPVRSRRVVCKDGEENVPVRSNIPSKSIKYMRDIVNTVINAKWRFILLMMILAHFTFWSLFAFIWYTVLNSYQYDIGDGKEHCVTGTATFSGLFMMAVETQMTIGYGTRMPNEECPEAIIIMVIEIVLGTALSGGLSSLLFTKLVRPNRHISSVGFSRKATVCLRDGQLCLSFRVWDLMNLHIIGSNITAYMLKPIRTLEGELVQNYIHQLKLKQGAAFLLWPITVVHEIDEHSPLYDLSAEDMMDFRFEIVVCLTGSSKNMGMVTQSRTSYLSKEIIWGYRFKNVVNYARKEKSYIIDVDNLNTVEQVETPLCSASRLKEFQRPKPTDYEQAPEGIFNYPSTYPSYRDDNGSLPSTISRNENPSPVFSRNGTQRSLGWNFKKAYPEKIEEHVEGK